MDSSITQHRFCTGALCVILVISANCQRRSEPLVSQTPTLGRGYLIVHNIGAGARTEDVLLNWKITGHYRYF